MSALSIQPTYPIFTDIDGQPLENGYVWIGTANLDPQTNPINVYWDDALTQLAAQPIRTRGGYPVNAGTPARLYVNSDYSIQVQNKNGSVVYSAPEATERYGAIITAADITYLPAGVGAVQTTVQKKLRDYVSVHDFMTDAQIADARSGSPTLDMTAAIQAALDTNRSVYFPYGVYLTDALTIPFGARGAIYFGDGFYHYTSTQQTVIKARSVGQPHIFRIGNSGPSGSDCLTFQQMRIECDNKAAIGIDATFGAFFTMMDAGVYNYISYGVYHKQGLARYDRVFMNTSPTTHPTAVGLHLYSDSAVTDSEFSGGGIPLKIVAGGNRIVNVWANTGAASCITLTPFDASTTHINTSMVNVYAGEVIMTAPSGVRPIIEMVGTPAQKVQEVQFSNSYLVTAAGDTYKKNGGIYMDYCDAVSISNIVIRGNGLGATANLYCDYFVKAQRSKTIAITGCSIKDVNKNPIYLVSAIDQPVVVSGCTFYNWGVGGVVTLQEAAAIRCGTGASATVTGNVFHIDTGSAAPYAVDAAYAADITFTGNRVSYANTNVVVAQVGSPSLIYSAGGVKRIENHEINNSVIYGTTVNNARQNYLSRGQISSAGGSTTTLTTLPNLAENQTYLVMVKQSGGNANSVVGFVSAYGGACTAYRISQDNTLAALDMNIASSGLSVQLTIGSGYGMTTWDWALTRLG